MNYNNVLAKGKVAVGKFQSPAITKPQVLGMWKVVQDMNTPTEPTLAIRTKKNGKFI